ncbi:von Willebrand factor A domain-containing protein 5A-like isoform X2 [Mytilus galloprovincialis]|uniref:von Willebrand factor A domain-containing protein 5A-like isoform X2 n=1 Tax=Mytilus galloprovincialis TaxID=29158 RepID=UPI003F7C9361
MDYRKLNLHGLLTEETHTLVPLKESKVHVTVQGFIVNVESQLTYSNDTQNVLQTIFIFPMDDMSAVYKFEADVNNKHIKAECQDKEKAKMTYNDAISSGHTAMFLSECETSADIFVCKLGNLPSGEVAILTMSYVAELSVETDGKMRFTLPTVLLPRYSHDVGHCIVPGREFIPGKVEIRNPCLLSFSATLSGCYSIKDVSSPYDKLNVKINEDKLSASIDLAEECMFDHDLVFDILYDNINKPEIILELGDKEKDGLLREDLLMLNFYPDLKKGVETEDIKTEFIFMIDRSGSMRGQRIQKANDTLLLLLKSLPVGCLFNVVSFGSDFELLFKQGSEEYNEETLKQAMLLHKKMNANMLYTDILRPLENIYSKDCKQGYSRQIFLLTDGGVGDMAEDIIQLAKKNNGNTRVFTFGIGEGVSTSLIKNVAKVSGGKATFIKDGDNMLKKVITAMKRSFDSSMSEVSLHWDIPKCFTIIDIPKEPPAIFHKEKLVLFALVQSHDTNKSGISGSFTLKGKLGGRKISHKVKIKIPSSSHNNLPLHRVAAKYQIKDLENDENDENDDFDKRGRKVKIILVSQAANIVSKYTAFVGFDKDTNILVSGWKESQANLAGCSVPESAIQSQWNPIPQLECSMSRTPTVQGYPDNGRIESTQTYLRTPSYGYPESSIQSQWNPMPQTDLIMSGVPSLNFQTQIYQGGGYSEDSHSYEGFSTTKGYPESGIQSQWDPMPQVECLMSGVPALNGCLGPENSIHSQWNPIPQMECSMSRTLTMQGTHFPHQSAKAHDVRSSVDGDGSCSASKYRRCDPEAKTTIPHSSSNGNYVCNNMYAYGAQRRNVEMENLAETKRKASENMMMCIVSLQNFDGSWSEFSELESVLNMAQKDLDVKYKGNIWCTAIVAAFLEKNFGKSKSEWEMIHNKAITWLNAQNRGGKSVTEMMQEVNNIIKTPWFV